MPKNTKGLNSRQEIFVAQYMVDGNATRSAIAAGYSHRSAASMGCELLKNPKVAAAMAEAKGKTLAKLEITRERVLQGMAELAYANMADFVKIGEDGMPLTDFSKLSREQMAALTEITVEEFMDGGGEDARQVRRVKFKLADKRGPLSDLGKHLNLFEGDGSGSKPVTIIIQGSDKGLL